MTIKTTTQLIAPELTLVNDLIRQRLHSQVELVNIIAEHIIHSGGKRTRPMLVILAAKALQANKETFLELAAIIEFIHTATLLHDDVVDGSLLRRGLNTANAVWGSAPSVLVGDFLYSRAFQMMVSLQDMSIMDILANATNLIAEGEVLQLMQIGNPEITEADYLQIIRCKTAELFKAATQLGAVAAHADPETCNALANYGLHLGMAYQITDDMLDYSTSNGVLGKNIGDDLAEGKVTLPLIYTLQQGTSQQIALIRRAISEKSTDKLKEIQTAISESNALQYCLNAAKREAIAAQQALNTVPDSDYKKALINLANFAYQRAY